MRLRSIRFLAFILLLIVAFSLISATCELDLESGERPRDTRALIFVASFNLDSVYLTREVRKNISQEFLENCHSSFISDLSFYLSISISNKNSSYFVEDRRAKLLSLITQYFSGSKYRFTSYVLV